jgi:hypothetical protein
LPQKKFTVSETCQIEGAERGSVQERGVEVSDHISTRWLHRIVFIELEKLFRFCANVRTNPINQAEFGSACVKAQSLDSYLVNLCGFFLPGMAFRPTRDLGSGAIVWHAFKGIGHRA